MPRFLHITDLHISAPETNDASQQTDTVGALERLLEIAPTLSPPPDFIVASGDLTNLGDDASYRLIADRLQGFGIPVVMTLGNHDKRAGWHAAFPGHSAEPDGPVDHDTVLAGMHVVALDSSVPGKTSGSLDDSQFSQAQTMLSRYPELPKVMAIHHPPQIAPDSDTAWASLDPTSTEKLSRLIKAHNVKAVFCGHIHMNRVTLWHGVPIVVTMGQQSTVDLTRADKLGVIEGTGFAICDLIGADLSVTFVPLSEPRLIKEISMDLLRSLP